LRDAASEDETASKSSNSKVVVGSEGISKTLEMSECNSGRSMRFATCKLHGRHQALRSAGGRGQRKSRVQIIDFVA
jgi:hypothetical protein